MENLSLSYLAVEEEALVPAGKEHKQSAAHIAHRFLNWFSGVSAVVSLSPFVLSALNVGKIKQVRDILDNNGACCTIIASKEIPGIEKNYSFSSIRQGTEFDSLDGKIKGIHGPSYGVAGLISSILLKTPKVGYHLGTGYLPDKLNQQLARIPKVGDYASQMWLANALAAGGIILAGELTGSALTKWSERRAEKEAQEKGEDVEIAKANAGTIGRAVSLGSKGIGLFIALPTILAGVGHAIQVTTATFSSKDIKTLQDIQSLEGPAAHIMAFLGKPMGECGGAFKAPSGVATASTVGLCCALPAAVSAVTLLASRAYKKNRPKEHAMNTEKLPENTSILKDSISDVITYHHSIPWERFEQEATEVQEQLAKAEYDAARRKKMAKIIKWSIRSVALAGALFAARASIQKSTPALSEESHPVKEAKDALEKFSAVVEQKDNVPSVMLNSPAENLDALKSPDKAMNFLKALLEKPQKFKLRVIQPRSMMKEGDNVPGCCVKEASGCCSVPYYRGDSVDNIKNALSNVIGALPQSSTNQNRLLAFTGITGIAAGAIWGFSNKIEAAISRKPRQTADELGTRHDVVQSLMAHMKRDGHVPTQAGMSR